MNSLKECDPLINLFILNLSRTHVPCTVCLGIQNSDNSYPTVTYLKKKRKKDSIYLELERALACVHVRMRAGGWTEGEEERIWRGLGAEQGAQSRAHDTTLRP